MKIFKIAGVPFTYAKGRCYCLEPICLDIETSNNHAENPEDLRTWIVSIQVLFNNEYFLFRYPEELILWFRQLYRKLKLKPNSKFKKRVICYIHNASYDLSYLIPYLMQLPNYDERNEGIIEGPNKILSFIRGAIEFRCSLRLSGCSLAKWSEEMQIEHKKLIGLYDYYKVLYPDSELSENEQDYDKIDVIAMKECLSKLMSYYRDSLVTIPFTSTGYIRRTLRDSCRKDKYYRKNYFLNNKLNAELFEMILRAYAGGYTHNNRYFKDRLVRVNKSYKYDLRDDNSPVIDVKRIRHGDFRSHYPTQMRANQVPLGKPQLIYDCSVHDFKKPIEEIIEDYPKFYSVVMIRIYKVELKDEKISMPFMQRSKCYYSQFDFCRTDNGRIIAAEGDFITYVDNLTLAILAAQYKLNSSDYDVLKVYRMKMIDLPDCISSVIDKYFVGKSEWKIKANELKEQYGKFDERTLNAVFEMNQCKKMINAIYGCCSMSPLRKKFTIGENFDFPMIESFNTEEEIEEGLKDYYKKYNNFLPYVLSGFITSAARFELFEYITAIGYQNILYSDTDSCFYISTPETEKAIERLNAEKHKKAPFVTLTNGEKIYYDVFEFESDCNAFKGLHSKCYGIVNNKNELELTVAGVPARTIIGMNGNEPVYYTREQELTDKGVKAKNAFEALDKLDDGFEFEINAGVCAIYIGATGYQSERIPTIQNINGHEIHTAGGCVIRKLKSKKVKAFEIKEEGELTPNKNYFEGCSPEEFN